MFSENTIHNAFVKVYMIEDCNANDLILACNIFEAKFESELIPFPSRHINVKDVNSVTESFCAIPVM